MSIAHRVPFEEGAPRPGIYLAAMIHDRLLSGQSPISSWTAETVAATVPALPALGCG